MKEYVIGKNKLEFETENSNLIVRNISNNVVMTIKNTGLPESEFDIENILLVFRDNLID